jgi:hypothetical protein
MNPNEGIPMKIDQRENLIRRYLITRSIASSEISSGRISCIIEVMIYTYLVLVEYELW